MAPQGKSSEARKLDGSGFKPISSQGLPPHFPRIVPDRLGHILEAFRDLVAHEVIRKVRGHRAILHGTFGAINDRMQPRAHIVIRQADHRR